MDGIQGRRRDDTSYGIVDVDDRSGLYVQKSFAALAFHDDSDVVSINYYRLHCALCKILAGTCKVTAGLKTNIDKELDTRWMMMDTDVNLNM